MHRFASTLFLVHNNEVLPCACFHSWYQLMQQRHHTTLLGLALHTANSREVPVCCRTQMWVGTAQRGL